MKSHHRGALVTAGVGALLLTLFLQLDRSFGLALMEPRVHVVMISLSILVSLGLGALAARMFYLDGSARALSLMAAFTGFAAIYVWHGVFTENGHPFAFLIYGPASRLAFGIALLGFMSPTIIGKAKRFQVLLGVYLGGLVLAGIGLAGHEPLSQWATTTDPANFYPVRVTVEALALAMLSIGLVRMLQNRTATIQPTPSMAAAVVLLILQSIFFIATDAWTASWWMAHALGAFSTAFLTATVYIDFQRKERGAETDYYRRMNAMKTNFINSAAHELGTPMTPIMMHLLLLEKHSEGMTDKQKKSVEMIGRNLRRLQALITRILDGSKTMAGKLELNRETFDLMDALGELHESYLEVAKRKGITCSFEADEGLVVNSDKIRVQQVIANAMDNALKFTPSGGSVSCRATADGEEAHITIQDTGTGMSPDLLDQLFEPFLQGPQTAVETQGSGLGLFLSKQIMNVLGGSLTASSEGEGKGSTMHIRIPLANS